MTILKAALQQPFSLQILAALHQHFGDAKQLRSALAQYFGSSPQLKAALAQVFGDTWQHKAALEQPVIMSEELKVKLDQVFGLAGQELKQALEQSFDLEDKSKLTQALAQLFALAASGALVLPSDVSVICDGQEIKDCNQVFLEQDEAAYHFNGELQLLSQDEALLFKPFLSEVLVTARGEEFRLTCDFCRRTRTLEGTIWVIPLVSRSALLDRPHSKQLGESAPDSGMSETICRDLAAGVDLDWQLPTWYLPADRLALPGKSPLEAIREIVASVRGVLQTAPDGTLIARPEYPVSVNLWSETPVAVFLTDQDYLFQIVEDPSPREGYNIFFISDSSAEIAGDGITLESNLVSSSKADIRVYKTPWNGAGCTLNHSGGAWVNIYNVGVKEAVQKEQVEIVAGVGRTSKSFHGLISASYAQKDLGEITVSEPGEVTTTVKENTLVDIEYHTKFYSFTATDPKIENVQFYPQVELKKGGVTLGKAITVTRKPADNQGDDISEPLLTSEVAKIARGRGEIDYYCSNRQMVSCQCPQLHFIPTGTLVEVMEEYGAWRGLCRYWSLTLTLEGNVFTADTRLSIEKESA